MCGMLVITPWMQVDGLHHLERQVFCKLFSIDLALLLQLNMQMFELCVNGVEWVLLCDVLSLGSHTSTSSKWLRNCWF